MTWLPAPKKARLEHAALRPSSRLTALLLLLFTISGCGRGTNPQTGQGPASALSSAGSAAIECVAPSRPSPAGGCVTRDAATGISLRVSAAYADVTGTAVQLEEANQDNYPLTIADDRLALQSGYVLKLGNGSYTSGPVSLLIGEPLPAPNFAPHTLIVASANFGPQIYLGRSPPTFPPAPPWLNTLSHLTLRVPFTINPARSGAYTYHMAPIVKQGVGVQVQALDISPYYKAFYGEAGGARIELRFTGLPADMELLSFIRVESQRTLDGGGTSGDRGPGLVELRIPGMTVNTPVTTFLQSPAWPDDPQMRSVDPTVGAAGTVQFEVAFQGSGIPTGQPATLTISDVQLLTGGIDGATGDPPTLPTYQITLPLK